MASIIEIMPYEEEKELGIFIGTISDIEDGKQVTLKVTGRYMDDEWDTFSRKYANFIIGEDSRIISSNGPVNISEFSLDNESEEYEGKRVCVVANGDEIIELTLVDLSKEPTMLKGRVKKVSGSDVTISNLDYYNHEDEEWDYDDYRSVTIGVETIIIKDGERVKQGKIEVGKDILVFKVADVNDNTTAVVMIED